jgi:hypothetical protein
VDLKDVQQIVRDLNRQIRNPEDHYLEFWQYPSEIYHAHLEANKGLVTSAKQLSYIEKLKTEFEVLKTLIFAHNNPTS